MNNIKQIFSMMLQALSAYGMAVSPVETSAWLMQSGTIEEVQNAR